MSIEETTVPGTNEHRIVVGVDTSPCARRALEFAADEAARWGALLHVVSLYHELPAAGSVVIPMGLVVEAAEMVVAGAIHRAEELEPSIVTKGETLLAAPGPGLTKVSQGATALVVGTRGHGKVGGLLLGSVSEYVLHHATCTTIVVR